MAMAEYRGVDGVARKVIKEYRGVDGVARRVVKGYRGVDGVARQYLKSHDYMVTFHTQKSVNGQYEVTDAFSGLNSDGYWECRGTVSYLGSGNENGRNFFVKITSDNLTDKTISFRYFTEGYEVGVHTSFIKYDDNTGEEIQKDYFRNVNKWTEYSQKIPYGTNFIQLQLWLHPESNVKKLTQTLLLADVCIDGENIM